MKSRILLRLTVCVMLLAMAYTLEGRGMNFHARPFYDCEGNACSVIELTWDEEWPQYRVKNDSNQPVKVEVSTFAGQFMQKLHLKELRDRVK